MPKFSHIGVALAASLALAACGGGGSPDTGSSGGSTAGSSTGADSGGSTGGSTGSGTTGGGSTGGGSTGGGNTGGGSTGGGSTGGGDTTPTTRTITIEADGNESQNAIDAFVDARPGDTIEFGCGFFEINQTLLLSNTELVTIKGCGKDATVLSFRNSPGIEGILADNVGGLVIEGLTVADSAGNGFELRSVNHGTLKDVRAFWSSDGGNSAVPPNQLTANNFQEPNRLSPPCENPMPIDPNVPENQAQAAALPQPPYTVNNKAGRYGIYPVKSVNILVEDSESIGASDAGIYVGQTSVAKIVRSRAAYNVFGFEIENVRHGEYAFNTSECNTGGFLIYDLDNISQYGERTIMHNNLSQKNNTYNFTEGGFVANVPSGSGLITLAYDRIDVYQNKFFDHNTGGIIHASYELFPEGAGRPNDNKIDYYTEGMLIFDNEFRNNGNAPARANSNDLANQDVAKLLPTIAATKIQSGCGNPTNVDACNKPNQQHPDANTGFRGAHILWDGLLDEYDPNCPYPTGNDGQPIPRETQPGYENKPRYVGDDPQPSCLYNAYKFDLSGPQPERIRPLFTSSCIESSNTFSDDSIQFANFNGLKGAGAAVAIASGQAPSAQDFIELQQFPASFDQGPHDCTQYGDRLTQIPRVEIAPYVPTGQFAAAQDPAEVARLCGADQTAGEVNFAAFSVDCPTLDQYNLFADAEDPRSTPNSGGVPFVMNSKLFSDYTTKYRVAFLPPNTTATYSAPGGESVNATIQYPVGTIIAKSFAFVNGNNEVVVETRLLIKRSIERQQPLDDLPRWAGLAYIWETDGSGNRIARLSPSGGTTAASWDYTDPETGTLYQGSTQAYSIPNQNQCLSCHANEDVDSGAAPIGPKVRNMNRPYRSESPIATAQASHESAGRNQIEYLCSTGRMSGCPDVADMGIDSQTQIAANLERIPKFNIPGDGGLTANSDEDIEQRARAWLEINCAHCHNSRGFAANTGFYVDVFRRVDQSHGICKRPTAAGREGTDGRQVDIHPGDASLSILDFRIGPTAVVPASKMPPIARSVVDVEAHALIAQWINNVVVADESKYPTSTTCTQNSN